MIRKDAFTFGFNAALGAALLALLLYIGGTFLTAVLAVISPFVGGLVVALLLDPVVTFLQKRVTRGSRVGATIIVMVFILSLVVGFFAFVIPNLIEQGQRLVRFFSPVTYTIRRTSTDKDKRVVVAQGVVETAYRVKGLVNGNDYLFAIYAVDADGVETPSQPISVTPQDITPKKDEPGGVPQELPKVGVPNTNAPQITRVALMDSGTVRLEWRAPTTGKSGFEILRENIDKWLTSHPKIGPIAIPPNIESLTNQYSDQVVQALRAYGSRAAEAFLGSIGGLLEGIVVPIIAFYILTDMNRLRARIVFLLPSVTREHVLTVAEEVGGIFSQYLRSMVTISGIYAVAAMVVLFVLSIFFPAMRGYVVLVGLVAGLLYTVPYIGALSLLLLAVIVAFASGSGVVAAGVTAFCLFLLNQFFDYVLMPRMVGEGVGLHPILALFALFLGGHLMGIWGMLLSVPIAASVQMVLFRLFPKLTAPTPLSLLMPEKGERDAHREEIRNRQPVSEDDDMGTVVESLPAFTPVETTTTEVPADAPPPPDAKPEA